MSISSQLTLLANTKESIRTSINNKGGSVGASDTFASYATAIDNLPSGGDNSTLIDLIERDITSINIPSGTTKIGDSSFYKIQNLTSVTIPNSVTIIDASAFENCVSLTSVTIPNSVTVIANNCFRGCTRLTSVQLSNSLTHIPGYAFYQTGITSIDIPSSVRTIAAWAFVYSGLTSVTLHEGLTSIAGFRGTNLTTIKIPSTVTSIDGATFYQCRSLTSVVCLPTTPPTLGSSVFDDTNNCPIYVPSASVAAYKAASGWSTYESRIYAIAQVATVDNTPVYNYDLGMTSTTMITSTNMQKMPTGTSLELAEGIVDAGGSFGNYTSITLPSTFSSFDDQGMIGNTTTTLTCLATTPPTAERNDIGGANLTAIYVPAANVADYQANAAWSGFSSIIQAIPTE